MPFVNYPTVNGQIVGQSTTTTFTQYLTDALGSVTATVNGMRVTNTYRYKPYGERLAKSGSGPDPDFQWTGDTGSRVTGRSRAEQYDRARHYGTGQATWSSVDPIWPTELPYAYTKGMPIQLTDPTGLAPDPPMTSPRVIGEEGISRTKSKCCTVSLVDIHVAPSCCEPYHSVYTSYEVHAECRGLYAEVSKCGIAASTFCKTMGSSNQCCNVANKYAVSAACLCSTLMGERSYYDFEPLYKRLTDCRLEMLPGDISPTRGCAQLSVGTLRNMISKLKSCNPGALRKIRPNPDQLNDYALTNKMLSDCKYSSELAALWLVSHMPPCKPSKNPEALCAECRNSWNRRGKALQGRQ